MGLDIDVIDYFKEQGAESGIPYQQLINLHLSQCVAERKTLVFA